jgi:hypothetical protein
LIEYLKTTPTLILKELDLILNDPCESKEEYELRKANSEDKKRLEILKKDIQIQRE